METIVNKVAQSGIVTINLEKYIPQSIVVFDLKPFLFMELILKEKDFRAALLIHDWLQYKDKYVALTCSTDAIIPMWAYMLVMQYLQPVATMSVFGNIEQARENITLYNITIEDYTQYKDARVVIKGCGEAPIPISAFTLITTLLKPHVTSIMYGEPCSTVPVYKRKKEIPQ